MQKDLDNSKDKRDEQHGQVGTMYQNWFLDYASYVIMERAVPYLDDGVKPVQRRVLHSMWELEDGRYNKVANIIGHTMKYHPHGDVSIGDALVQIGQKNLLIDTQGNWGNILTGDSAAASRYIEARLSKFALEVLYNPKTTIWQASYDGRNKEPVALPVKFPLLLAMGVEGIAVSHDNAPTILLKARCIFSVTGPIKSASVMRGASFSSKITSMPWASRRSIRASSNSSCSRVKSAITRPPS